MKNINTDELGGVILKWTIIAVVGFAFALSMTGCNTVRERGWPGQGRGDGYRGSR